MKQRHQVLSMSIGAHPEEENAMETIKLLMKVSIAYISIATMLEATFFVLYNGPSHPFSKILDTSTGKLTKYIVIMNRVITIDISKLNLISIFLF